MTLSVTNSFTSGTAAVASQVNTNFSDIVAYVNGTGGNAGVLLRSGGTLTGALTVGADGSPAASTLFGAVTVGQASAGYNVTFHGASSTSMVWNNTNKDLTITGTSGEDALIVADGRTRLDDRVYCEGTDDVDLDAVSGGLIVGGDGSGQHIAIDGNEIQSKSNATTASDLNLNILGGQVVFPDGSASAPAIANTGDANTGIYFSAADEVSITTGGTKRFTIESTGLIKSPHSYVAETGNAANLWVDTDGGFYRYTSSARIKTNIETLDDNVADNVLNLRPVSYNSTAEPDDPTQIFWGFIAEEVDKVDPTLVQYGDNGRIDGVNYVQIIPALLNIIKRQEARITALEG